MLCVALSFGLASCDNDNNRPIPTYSLTVQSSNNKMGTVTGSGVYERGTKVILEATATKEASIFVKWSDGNTENPREITLMEDKTITAYFDYAYVDLGLSVKWATCNVGADSVHHFGDYFAWGETSTKYYYDITSYKWYTIKNDNGVWNIETIIKYNTNNNCGNVDYNTKLDAEDDAATINMGKHWRMPTKDEQEELVAKCIWIWTDNYEETGVAGYIVTSKINGNHIFLPAAGFRDGSDLKLVGASGRYWSSSLYMNLGNSFYSCDIYFDSLSLRLFQISRDVGLSVRGVKE